MSKNYIKEPRKRKGSNNKIPEVRNKLSDKPLTFSYKFLDLSCAKFSIDTKEGSYFSSLFDRLKNLSCITCREFLANKSPALRSHPIDWQKTSEPDGFKHLNSHLQDEAAYQFSVSSNEGGRVHGLIIDEIFYVVWFDPDHALYP